MSSAFDGELFEVVPFTEKHIAEAAQIEKICFSEPWSEKALEYMCSSPTAHAVAVTVRSDGSLAAYGGMEYVLDEADIANVAVRPDMRRRGCARAVLAALEEFALAHGVKTLYLEVRVSNTPARTLYKSAGFEEVGLRRGYYRLPAEDGIIMSRTVGA